MHLIPFANDTVTLVYKEGAQWSTAVIPGCSYRRIRRRMLMDSAVSQSEETVCRIPAGNPFPAPGDVILLGEHAPQVGSEIELSRLLEAFRPGGAFRVQSVADNARPGMPIPHYAARGA